jgi:hypothetical protein
MNYNFLRAICAASSMACVFFANSQAQDFDQFLRAGEAEAAMLTRSYMEPLVVGFSYGMSNGWYNTAKTHQALGFDLTISANMAMVPASRELFLFDQSQFQHVYVQGEEKRVATVMGPDEGFAQLLFEYTDENTGNTVTGAYTPAGLGLQEEVGINAVPAPVVQFSMGTFKNTDIIIRYMPKVTIGEYETQMFGLGIKHDIKQWMPFIRRLPIDISVLAACSGFDNTYDMTALAFEGDNQEAIFDVNNWTAQALVSKKISVLTLYAGVGITGISSDLSMYGTYVIDDEINPENSFVATDPISLRYKESSFVATAGLRLKFAFFTLHGSYTHQEYSVLAAGFGFSFR